MINNNNVFIAEVRNIKDPWKAGRVQIRVYGNHDNEQDIKDDDLPWATPLQPITSAATGKVGIIPVGMVVGSRVFGLFIDDARQHPIILGTFARAAKLNGDDNSGGQEGLDKTGNDVPSPGRPKETQGKTPNNAAVDDSQIDPTGAKYNEAPYKEDDKGQDGFDYSRKQNAPNADKATIAALDPSLKLPDAIAQVGTSGEVLKNMMSLLNIVKGIMAMANSGSGSGAAGGGGTGVVKTVTTALTGALAIIANKYGFLNVIQILTKTFSGDAFYQLEQDYDTIMIEAIVSLVSNAAKYGTTDIPYPTTPTVIYQSVNTPVPQPIYGFAPDFYVQQYYSPDSDPWPGFVQWLGPKGDYIYTVRGATQPNYSTPQQAVYDAAQTQLANLLSPYFENGVITVQDFNKILDEVSTTTTNNGTNAILGNNSSSNIMAMAMQLLGIIGSMINQAQSSHLPSSVLNVGSMTETLNKFTKNIAYLQQMKNISKPAFSLPNALGALSSLGSLGGDLGNALSSLGSLGGVASTLAQATGALNNVLSILPNGGLSPSSISNLLNAGISQSSVSNINSISQNNVNLSQYSIATIASVTSVLEKANISQSEINQIQILLSEIILN